MRFVLTDWPRLLGDEWRNWKRGDYEAAVPLIEETREIIQSLDDTRQVLLEDSTYSSTAKGV